MPVDVKWYIENRLALFIVYGDFTVEDIRQLTASSRAMFDSGTAPIHAIVDVNQLKKFPLDIQEVRNSMVARGPKVGWLTLVGTNPLVRFLLSAVSQLGNYKIRAFNTRDEAITF